MLQASTLSSTVSWVIHQDVSSSRLETHRRGRLGGVLPLRVQYVSAYTSAVAAHHPVIASCDGLSKGKGALICSVTD